MTPDPIKQASKPTTMLVLDCLIREHLSRGAQVRDAGFVAVEGFGATTSDVVRLMRWHYDRNHEHGTLSKRLSELAAAGWIADTGHERVSQLTKRPQTIWEPTAAGRVAHARWRDARRWDAA